MSTPHEGSSAADARPTSASHRATVLSDCSHHLGHDYAVGIKRLTVGRRLAVEAQLPGDGVPAVQLPPGQQQLAQLRRVSTKAARFCFRGRRAGKSGVSGTLPGDGLLRSGAESDAKEGDGVGLMPLVIRPARDPPAQAVSCRHRSGTPHARQAARHVAATRHDRGPSVRVRRRNGTAPQNR